jgi:hypothetical protein
MSIIETENQDELEALQPRARATCGGRRYRYDKTDQASALLRRRILTLARDRGLQIFD